MKIALLGYGKMGQLIESIAIEKGHQIILKTSKQTVFDLQDADVAIDFSHFSSALSNLKQCLKQNVPLIIGTTGWNDHLDNAREMTLKSDGSCLFAPNFSIGIYLFQKMIEKAANLMKVFPDYDVTGIEYHHSEKKDCPSGTALQITEKIHETIPKSSFAFTSVRCGKIPGTHTILFDSAVDSITLSHCARNREGFARGALQAAEWIQDKKGFFTFDDLMSDLFQEVNHEI